jgi:3-methyladenine DNA glycosylase/8-oxoguanine DNA glycosylase
VTGPGEPPDIEARIRPRFEVDPLATVGALWYGPGDPQLRMRGSLIERAARTPAGPVGMRVQAGPGDEIRVEAWGMGAEWAVETLPDLLGAADRPELLEPRHPLITRLVRAQRGLRMTRTGLVLESLVRAILAQKVTGDEARRAYRLLAVRHGEAAPGPLRLHLVPSPAQLARLPYWAFHRIGVERRRAETIRRVAIVAARLDEVVTLAPAEAARRLLSISGVGAWTVAETLRPALGDPDAVSVGDYHVPNLVSWALAGEPRGNDERMLELLEPYRGQRARVVLLLERSGLWAPRYGPRMAPRSISAI